ncbi:MAG: hypothetical protein ACQES5_08275 [Thermodesulfobacteriota bacterium]
MEIDQSKIAEATGKFPAQSGFSGGKYRGSILYGCPNRNLLEMVEKGDFRKDLGFRLNVFPVHIRPLRRREEDISTLPQYFTEHEAAKLKIPKIPGITSRALEIMQDYHWPGNVRKMENRVGRALIQSLSDVLEI